MADVPRRVLVTGPASWNLTVRVGRLPEPRPHTVVADGWADGLGGTSAGKAVTLAALGVDVTLRTVLGEDDAAARIGAALARPRLEVVAVPAADRASERHVNLVADDGSRLSVYLTLPDAVPAAARPVEDLLVGVDAAVVDLAEHSRPVLAAARAAGVPVWCDVHDDDGVGEYARAFTAAADVVVASHVRVGDPASYLRARLAEGARLAVCTRGAAGALAVAADGTDGEPRWYDVGPAPVHAAVQAEGAGDAFTAGLLWATLEGLPLPVALATASAAGAVAVAGPGLGAPDATPGTVRRLAERVVVTPR